MPDSLNTTVRELDCRTNDHIEVRLLWNPLTDSVSVSVHDTSCGGSFQFDVAPDRALEAFHHPFAYVGDERNPRSHSRASTRQPAARKDNHDEH